MVVICMKTSDIKMLQYYVGTVMICTVSDAQSKREEIFMQKLSKAESARMARHAISVLTSMLSTHQWEVVRPEFEFAINELKKCIPTKPIRQSWEPNRCPNCDADLGGDCDDGYYENPWYQSCPECRQLLDYNS